MHRQPDSRLPFPVRFILDDFSTNTVIPDFDKAISVIRSREIYLASILSAFAFCRTICILRAKALPGWAVHSSFPDFDKAISVIRSREIYVSLVIQSLSQLEGLYGHARAQTIINNCDHCLYLGGTDTQTAVQ